MSQKSLHKNSYIGRVSEKYSERTVARDLAIRLVMALSASLMFAGLCSFIYQTRSDRNDLRSSLSMSTSNLASLLALPLWTYNETELKSLAKSHSMADEIMVVRIVDDAGKTVAEAKKPGKSVDLTITKNVLYKNKKIGKLFVSASTTPLYTRAWKNFAWTAVLTLLTIAIIMLLILPLLERFLDEPLNKLVIGIQRIASGQYREKLPSFPQKELMKITDEVNFMADKIANREQQIINSMQDATVLKTELGIAETIQRSMTATRGFNTARRVAQYYQPMEKLSGDWMTVFECDKGRTIYAMVGDVTGHGIPQGLVTMAAFGSIQTLRPLIQQNSKSFSPSTILNILRGTLVTVLHECELAMTVSIIKIDLMTRQIAISSAGHPFPLIVRPIDSKMKIVPLSAKAQSPLGFEFLTKTTAPPAYEDSIFKIDADDVVCIFSDGLTEARNKNETQFNRTFLSTLRSLDRRYPPSVVLDRVMQKFQEHMKGASVADDICLMILDTRKDENHEAVA